MGTAETLSVWMREDELRIIVGTLGISDGFNSDGTLGSDIVSCKPSQPSGSWEKRCCAVFMVPEGDFALTPMASPDPRGGVAC